MLWTVCSICMVIFLTLATYVQQNDPDGPLWMTVYGMPAVFTLLEVCSSKVGNNLMFQTLVWLHMLACIVGAGYLLQGIIRNGSSNDSNLLWYEKEEGRELGGLIFVILWLVMCQLRRRSIPSMWISVLCVVIVTSPVCLWLYTYFDEGYRENLPGHCKDSI